MLHGDAAASRSNSAISAAVDPSVISVPPSSTNLASSCRPSIPMPPRMSSRLIDDAQVGRQLRSSYTGSAGCRVFGMPLIMRLRGAADVREDDHVVLGAQVAVAQLLIGEVGVRHAVVIERRAHPAFVLRARPGMHVADARHRQLVRLHRGRRGHGPRRQAPAPSTSAPAWRGRRSE